MTKAKPEKKVHLAAKLYSIEAAELGDNVLVFDPDYERFKKMKLRNPGEDFISIHSWVNGEKHILVLTDNAEKLKILVNALPVSLQLVISE